MRLLKHFFMSMNARVRRRIFARPSFIRRYFRVEVMAPSELQSFCEWSSILQHRIAPKYLSSTGSVLDMGTGAHALLAIDLKKRFPQARVAATEILPDRMAWAKKTAERNAVALEFFEGNLFCNVPGRFDLILFDPPAIPSRELAELGFESKSYPGLGSRRCWSGDGGCDGLEIIREFLDQASRHLTPAGRLIIAVNPIHCGAEAMCELIQTRGLRLERIHRIPGIVNAYVATPSAT
jgi:methylase of polypeptide subunit release factors